MKNLKISTRLTLSILFFVLPLAVLLYSYIGTISANIETARMEQSGDAYLRPLIKALDKAEDHYTLKLRLDSGDMAAAAQLKATTDDVNKAFEEIRAVNERLGEAL